MKGIWIIYFALGIIALLVACYFLFQLSAFDDQGFKDFCGESKVIQDGLTKFYKHRENYPAYTLDDLQKMGAFDGDARDEYWIHFTPFSAKTPGNQIVLRMGYNPFCFIPQLCDFSWTKYELTHDPNTAQSVWVDRLEDAKEKQVQSIVVGHSEMRIISAFAWFDGNEPANSHAELIVDYATSGQKEWHRMHYDLWKKGDAWSVGEARLLR